jgi:hypothetical protein
LATNTIEMQLKLELFEESLDKYRKGSRLNQKLLQTGKPRGTFRKGDAHPAVNGLVYMCWESNHTNKEKWVTLIVLEKEKERRLKYQREFRETGNGKLSDRKYRYSSKGKATITKQQKKYRKTEAYKAVQAKYRRTEKRRKVQEKYDKSPKGRISSRNYAVRRRARILESNVNLTEYEEGEIKQIYAHAVRLSNKLQIPFDVDHIVPLSVGGIHHPNNLQVVPAAWNRSKGNRNTERWLPNGM